MTRLRRFGAVLLGVGVSGLLPGSAGQVVTARRAPVTDLAFTQEGRGLLAATGARLRLLRSSHPRGETDWPTPFPRLSRFALAPSGDRIALAGGAPGEWGGLYAGSWPPPPGGWKGNATRGHRDLPSAAEWNDRGDRIATGAMDGRLAVWTVGPAGQPRATSNWDAHPGGVQGLLWTPGPGLVSTGVDRALKLWPAAGPEAGRTVGSHLDAALCLAGGPAAPQFACATGGEDRTVRIWLPLISRQVRILRGFRAPVLAVSFNPDGSVLFAGDAAGRVSAWDAGTGERRLEWEASASWIHALAVSPDGRILATGDGRGRIRFWDPKTGKETRFPADK